MSDHTSSVVLSTEELQKRIDAFADAIGVDVEIVKEKLAEEGVDFSNPDQAIHILDNENYLPFADLAKAFLDTGLTKKAPLRLGIAHLRGNTTLSEPNNGIGDLANAVQEMANNNRSISTWRDSELLEAYDDASPKIWKELKDRAHGRPFVVFNKDGSINAEDSLKMLQIAKRQTIPDKMRIGDELKRVHPAGYRPEKPLDASPLFENIPLVGDYCSESDTTWEGISHKRRVIVRIHVTNVEKKTLSHGDMKRIALDARNSNDAIFKEGYGHAHLLYDELEEQSKLPTLKLVRNKAQKKIDNAF